MKVGGKLATALAAAALIAPASAGAATITITGDDGNPLPLAPNVAASLRNININVDLDVPAGDGASWKWSVVGPGGATATSIPTDNCWTSIRKDGGRIVYAGNGGYSLALYTYTGDRCTGTPKVTAYGWNVGASVALGQPAGPLLLRPQNNLSSTTHLLDFAGNPGASYYEVKFAKNGAIGPDGGISGPSNPASVDPATGKVKFTPYDGPGAYVMVARATYGTSSTAWSAPITLQMQSPFDMSSVTFPDSRGPSYQLRGTVREKAISGGRVTVAVAKGKKGKKFRTLGKAKVNSQGVFKLRFRLARGTYRVRYSYSGGTFVTRGTVYAGMKITRRLF